MRTISSLVDEMPLCCCTMDNNMSVSSILFQTINHKICSWLGRRRRIAFRSTNFLENLKKYIMIIVERYFETLNVTPLFTTRALLLVVNSVHACWKPTTDCIVQPSYDLMVWTFKLWALFPIPLLFSAFSFIHKY